VGVAAASEACHHGNELHMLHVVRRATNLQYQALTVHNLQTRRAQTNPFNTCVGIQSQPTTHCYGDRIAIVIQATLDMPKCTAISMSFEGEALGEAPRR